MKLDVVNHDRDSANLRYVYPVVSRRAGGVSVGVNLNPNNACNFRCIYCQVPELSFGKGPAIDLALLETELSGMLSDIVEGDFMQRRVPPEAQRLNDVAFSGNGEPTSSPDFVAAVDVVARVLSQVGLLGKVKVILITNGTLTHRPEVERGISRMAEMGGQVWFKLDSATQEGASRVNSSTASVAERLDRLARVSRICPTWIQTCLFARDGEAPSRAERDAYLAAVSKLLADGAPLEGVLLYGLARPSMQPEAPSLSRLDEAWLAAFAEEIRELGLPVKVSA